MKSPKTKKKPTIVSSKCSFVEGYRGLQIKKVLEFNEWTALLKTFLLIENAMPFIIGDLIGYGELQYEPSRYQEAIRLTGRTENILQNWASICRLIPPEDRIYDLSYSYYQEVSPLDKDQQHHFLSMALKRKWHKRWLRAHPASDGALIESRKGNTEQAIKQPEEVLEKYPATSSSALAERALVQQYNYMAWFQLAEIGAAFEEYYQEKGVYPKTIEDVSNLRNTNKPKVVAAVRTLSPSTCEIRTYHEKGSKRFSRIMGSGLHGPIQKEDL
jgi:tetratricopeptide (TPR) repeat protein